MLTDEGKKNCQELPKHPRSEGTAALNHLFDQGQSERKVRREDHSRLREKEGGRGIYGRSTLDPKHAAPNLPHVAILIPVGIWSAEEVGLKPAPEMSTEDSALPPPAQRVDAAWSSRHSWTTHTRVKACEVVVTARTAVVIPVGTGPRARGTPG